jgi:hypothetical protein
MKGKPPQLDDLEGFAWHCEPPGWGFNHQGLFLEPAAKTDFWQRTHYGFSADNGHFFFKRLAGDFVISATVRSSRRHQYDQAGLMIRQDAECWIKTSVEYEPESPNRLGVVVTQHGFSDWSTQDLVEKVEAVLFRVARTGSGFIVSARLPNADWTQLRLVRLACDPTGPLAAGPYACSPKAAGFRCVFTEIAMAQSPTANARSWAASSRRSSAACASESLSICSGTWKDSNSKGIAKSCVFERMAALRSLPVDDAMNMPLPEFRCGPRVRRPV